MTQPLRKRIRLRLRRSAARVGGYRSGTHRLRGFWLLVESVAFGVPARARAHLRVLRLCDQRARRGSETDQRVWSRHSSKRARPVIASERPCSRALKRLFAQGASSADGACRHCPHCGTKGNAPRRRPSQDAGRYQHLSLACSRTCSACGRVTRTSIPRHDRRACGSIGRCAVENGDRVAASASLTCRPAPFEAIDELREPRGPRPPAPRAGSAGRGPRSGRSARRSALASLLRSDDSGLIAAPVVTDGARARRAPRAHRVAVPRPRAAGRRSA